MIAALGVGFFLGLGIGIFGWSESILEDYNIVVSLVAVIFSIGVAMLILRYLGRVSEEDFYAEPPQPPRFGYFE